MAIVFSGVYSHLRFSHLFERKIIGDSLARFKVKDKSYKRTVRKKDRRFSCVCIIWHISGITIDRDLESLLFVAL